MPFSLDIIFQFKAEINNSRNNTALRETPSTHARLAQHRGNVVWMVWKTPRSAAVPMGPTAVQHSSLLWRLNQESHVPLTFQQVCFIFALGTEFRGKKSHLHVACRLTLSSKSHVMFACGSIEYCSGEISGVHDVKHPGLQWVFSTVLVLYLCLCCRVTQFPNMTTL